MTETKSKYRPEIIKRAIQLYNYEINGQRVYRVDAIPDILKREFGESAVRKLKRGTIYFWLLRYDSVNYRIRREQKND